MPEIGTQQRLGSVQQDTDLPALETFYRRRNAPGFAKVIGHVTQTPQPKVTLRNVAYDKQQGYVEVGKSYNVTLEKLTNNFSEVE